MKNKNIVEIGNGNVTIADISKVNPDFTKQLSGNYNSATELYNELKSLGSLRLKNATLIIDKANDKQALCFDRLELVNSQIYVRSNDLSIVCNEYLHQGTSMVSFDSKFQYAKNGSDGTKPGAKGEDGEEGLSSGNIYVHVTDQIQTTYSGIDVSLFGQNGGTGGNGIDGKKGATGSRGRSCSDGVFNCKTGPGNGGNGGRGGKGGDAGDGGNGGDGGELQFKIHGNRDPFSTFFNFKSRGGYGNVKGAPGTGGAGGNGGRAGSCACSFCSCTGRGGNIGPIGYNGEEGNNGANGATRKMLRASFQVEEINEFISIWNAGSINTSTLKLITQAGVV